MPIPKSPLQPGLLEEILDIGRQAAAIGLGEDALYDLDLRLFVMRIVRQLLSLVGVLFVAYLVYGGALWMTAAGAEENRVKGRKCGIKLQGQQRNNRNYGYEAGRQNYGA